jgi:hypothetical protein
LDMSGIFVLQELITLASDSSFNLELEF